MDRKVIIIKDRNLAENFNNGLNDDQKVVFEHKTTGVIYAYETVNLSGVSPLLYQSAIVSDAALDGTFPLSKRRKMFT